MIGMGSLLVFVALAILVLIIVAKTAVVVPQQNAYVVERLGRYSGTLGAGFHILMPFLDVIRYRHSLKEAAYDIPAQVCITRDNVQVGVDGILYLKVLNAERANLRATDEQVAVAKSGLRPNISASGDAAFQNQESDFVGGGRSQSSNSSNVQTCDAATAALEPAFCAFLASQSQANNVGNIESQLSSDGVTHPRGYSVTLSQTVFQGFQNINAIHISKAKITKNYIKIRFLKFLKSFTS